MPLIEKQSSPANADDVLRLPGQFPDVPDDIQDRFKSAPGWDADIKSFYRKVVNALNDFGQSNADVTNQTQQQTGNLLIQVGELTASIQVEIEALINEDEILARRIVTVSALAGKSSNIKVQNTAPGSPSLNDIWVDNSDLTLPITYEWDGSNWVEVTEPITVAAVAAEQTARITSDGFLSGKFTLTVIAGNVVTGMNITSSSGGGTNISSVIFRATDFQIYNGTSGIVMFNVSGSTVQLAQTLTVSTAGKVYIGTGTYNNTNTPWYVDSSGFFSLKDQLTWNPTTGVLTIAGTISATTGTIGGWTVGATTLTGGTLTLDSSGSVRAGQTAYNTGTGFWLGLDSGTPKFSIGNTTNKFLWDGTNLTVQMTGALTITSDLLSTDSTAALVWQGPSLGTRSFAIQRAATGVSFNMLAVGSTQNAISFFTAKGTYVAQTDTTADSSTSILNSITRTGGAYDALTRVQTGVTTNCGGSGETPYWTVFHRISGGTTAGYLVWNYDAKLYFASGIGPANFYGAPYVNDPLTNIYRSTTGTLKTDGALVVSGVLTAKGVRQTAATTSVFTKTANVTLSDITGLTLTLQPGTYHVEASVPLSCTTSGGYQFALSGTLTQTSTNGSSVILPQLNGTVIDAKIVSAFATAFSSQNTTSGTVAMLMVNVILVVTVAGTLTLQFAQNNNAGASSVLVGAVLAATPQ